MDNRSGLFSRRRRDQDEVCPLTVEYVDKLMERLAEVERRTEGLPVMTAKVNELHEKLIHARGFVAGMGVGGFAVVVGIGCFFVFLYGVFSGKIGIKELFGGLF